MNMQEIKIISLFCAALQTFLKSAKRPVLVAYILGSKKLKREVRTCAEQRIKEFIFETGLSEYHYLSDTREEKIYEKDIQNKYAAHKNHFTFLFKATIFYVFSAKAPLKMPLPVSL